MSPHSASNNEAPKVGSIPEKIDTKDAAPSTRADLDSRMKVVEQKMLQLHAKTKTRDPKYLNVYNNFYSKYNIEQSNLVAVQTGRAQFSANYCGTRLDKVNDAVTKLENIINTTIDEAKMLDALPAGVESKTFLREKRVDVKNGPVRNMVINVPSNAALSFKFDTYVNPQVLNAMTDGKDKVTGQSMGNLGSTGFEISRSRASANKVIVSSNLGFTYSYDETMLFDNREGQTAEDMPTRSVNRERQSSEELKAKEEVKKDLTVVRDVLANEPETPAQNPEIYQPAMDEVMKDVADNHDISPKAGYAARVEIIDNQMSTGRMVHAETGEIHDVNRTGRDPKNHHDIYELQAANKVVEEIVKNDGGRLIEKTGRQLEDALNHLTDIVRTTNQNPDAVKKAIRTLDALLLYSKENGHNTTRYTENSNLQSLLAKKREELVAWLPKTEKAPESARFESYETMVDTLESHRRELETTFKKNKSIDNGILLADAIKAQLYTMRQYKMNDKNHEGAKFPYKCDELVAQLDSVQSSITAMRDMAGWKDSVTSGPY